MAQSTLTYDVSTGSGSLQITGSGRPNSAKIVSYQVDGDGAVNGAVTVKMQEANTFGGTYKDIAGANATVNVSTSEYVDGGQFNSAFLKIDISVGTATLGILTFVINYK